MKDTCLEIEGAIASLVVNTCDSMQRKYKDQPSVVQYQTFISKYASDKYKQLEAYHIANCVRKEHVTGTCETHCACGKCIERWTWGKHGSLILDESWTKYATGNYND